MEPVNLLLLTVYLLIVVYVFNQANKSLDNQVRVVLNDAFLKEQLEAKELSDVIEIKFTFKDSYRFEELTKLQMSLKNKSEDDVIRIDWNESAIVDFEKVTGRVIRLTPGMTDIPQEQKMGPILPGQSIKAELSDDNAITGPLFKADKFKKATGKSVPFYLRLALTVSTSAGAKRSYAVRCQFIPKKLLWPKALTIALKQRV